MLKRIRSWWRGLVERRAAKGRDEALWNGLCPDCGGRLLEGPSGGLCINMKCSQCGNKFNVGFFESRVVHFERI